MTRSKPRKTFGQVINESVLGKPKPRKKQGKGHRCVYDRCGDYKFCPNHSNGHHGWNNNFCRCGKRKP